LKRKSGQKKEKDTLLQAARKTFFIFPKAYGINTAQPHSPIIYSVSFWKKFAATSTQYFLFFLFFF